MSAWTYDELVRLARFRAQGLRTSLLCIGFHSRHTRDEVIEAIWALRRYPDTYEAFQHLRDVMQLQAARVPLVNGREAWKQSPVPGSWWPRAQADF